MTKFQPEEEMDAWRVLLFAQNGSELLVLRRPSGLCLPALRIPRWQRVAPNLNAEAKRVWQLETICLVPFEVSHPNRVTGDPKYHLMEVRKAEDLTRVAPNSMAMSALKEDSFQDVRDYLAVRRAMELDGPGVQEGCQGPFSEFASFRRISGWVEEQLEPLGRHWDGALLQLQASASFALIRFETNGNAVWFKAAGEPNRREFPITAGLSALFPKHVAKVIAVREDWNAWLAEEVDGKDLFSIPDPASWQSVAESLAELQIASIGQAPRVLACGAHDARSARLLSMVAPFFSAIASLMEAQTKPRPPRLAAQEIHALQRQVTQALLEIEARAVPDALNHFDLNPGNVFVRAGKCKFLDWAEAAVGNPFLSMEYLRQHFVRAFGGQEDAASEVSKSYSNAWRSLLPDSTVKRMFELVPLIAVFAFAVTVLPWEDPQVNLKPETAGFLRSLARRMRREGEQLSRRAA